MGRGGSDEEEARRGRAGREIETRPGFLHRYVLRTPYLGTQGKDLLISHCKPTGVVAQKDLGGADSVHPVAQIQPDPGFGGAGGKAG